MTRARGSTRGTATAIHSLPLRQLASRQDPTDRIFHHNIYFRGHNNARYEALLPRLHRIDPYLVTCSDRRLLRAAEFRLLRATRAARNRALLRLAARRYRYAFVNDIEQIRYFPGSVVVDVDDPKFSADEIGLLNRPNVRAYVVTAPRAAERFQELGVRTPHHVIPQGVDVSGLDPQAVKQVARECRREGDLVVGYVAAWLLCAGDRDGASPLYAVDHLLSLWGAISGRLPSARLWLIGQASQRVRDRCEGRDDIVIFGRLPQAQAHAHVANFDVALYPRTVDQGISAVKVAEYMGLGIPTVSYDLEVTRMLRESGAGLLVRTPEEFVDAVVSVLSRAELKAQLASAAARGGQDLDMNRLARRYADEIFARYLPRDAPLDGAFGGS